VPVKSGLNERCAVLLVMNAPPELACPAFSRRSLQHTLGESVKIRLRDDGVNQTNRNGLVSVDRNGADEQFRRGLNANQSGKDLRAAESGEQAKPDFRHSETGAGCSYSHVGAVSYDDSAPINVPVHCSENWLPRPRASRLELKQVGAFQRLIKLGYVRTRKESPPFTGDHDRFSITYACGVYRGHKTVSYGLTQRIYRRVVSQDRGNATAVFNRNWIHYPGSAFNF